MIAFGTVAEMISALISTIFNGPVKQVPGFFNLIANFRQIDKSEWSSVFLYQVFQAYTVESQVAVSQVKSLLGEVIGLFY